MSAIVGPIQKYSKSRYISHNKVIILTDKPFVQQIKKIVSSPKKIKSKLVLVKGSVIQTHTGKSIIITNKPSRKVPTGVQY